ncbi:MAG: Asp23/Gls24 family envelope stress response protein [Firmicutes bacterium]|nr:Asp23/Gls24 family envelope stress response protein [Bacillota bacterium]
MVLKTNNELGEIFVSNNVVAEISGAVAAKCYGVVGMASRSKKDGIVNLLKRDAMTKGIGVSVDNSGIAVDMHIIVEYGTNITSVCKSIVNRVRYTIENTLGLKVNRVDVRVEGIRVDD